MSDKKKKVRFRVTRKCRNCGEVLRETVEVEEKHMINKNTVTADILHECEVGKTFGVAELIVFERRDY